MATNSSNDSSSPRANGLIPNPFNGCTHIVEGFNVFSFMANADHHNNG